MGVDSLKRKENTENFGHLDTKLPQADCLAILGRGIERVETRQGEVWKPSRYVQNIDTKREGRFLLKTGRLKGDLQEHEQQEMIVSGGTAVVLGGLQYLEESAENKPLIIMAAGRPDYLKNAPEGMSEGSVMKDELLRRAGQALDVIVGDDKDTFQGVLHSLQTAKERGLRSITFSTIELHMPRVKAFHKYVLRERPEYTAIQTYFVTAEDLLRRRYAKNSSRLHKFERIQRELHESDVWKETLKREQHGVRAIEDGTYWKNLPW